jgi:hypothetical protein
MAEEAVKLAKLYREDELKRIGMTERIHTTQDANEMSEFDTDSDSDVEKQPAAESDLNLTVEALVVQHPNLLQTWRVS